MVVDGSAHTKDLILLPDKIIPNWWRKTGHVFDPGDCREILSADPDMIVFGLGAFGLVKLDPELIETLAKTGIKYRSAATAEAVKLFNQFAPSMKTAGAFHLTC